MFKILICVFHFLFHGQLSYHCHRHQQELKRRWQKFSTVDRILWHARDGQQEARRYQLTSAGKYTEAPAAM